MKDLLKSFALGLLVIALVALPIWLLSRLLRLVVADEAAADDLAVKLTAVGFFILLVAYGRE